MRSVGRARLLLFLLLAIPGSTAATVVTFQNAGEVCRFHAAAGDPFQRWLSSQEVTCVASGSDMTFGPGLWNVFARSANAISAEPILVTGDSAPASLTIPAAPAAKLSIQLPPGETAVVYSPKRALALPIQSSTEVPAGEELWLFVLAKSIPVAIDLVPAMEAGTERTIDARSLPLSSDVVGWIQLDGIDRAALRAAHGVNLPRLRISAASRESEAAALPAPEALDGAIVLFQRVNKGSAELQFGGRGWISSRRRIIVTPQTVTLIREPIIARPSATLVVNWSTYDDLPALDRSLGGCDPTAAAPRFELTISSCTPAAPGQPADSAVCQPIRKEALDAQVRFGSVTIEEVLPGLYRAELRFGRLPALAVTSPVAPLQLQPIRIQAAYITAYGSLTRGGVPVGEDARIEFPRGGIGFATGKAGEYRAVLTSPIGPEAKIDVVTCRGERTTVLTDMPMMRNARYDIDIPDNLLTLTVVDTFTRIALPSATVRYVVMSKSIRPRFAVLTRTFVHDKAEKPADDRDQDPGRFVIKAVPPQREIRIQVSNSGYKKKDVEPFSMTRSDKKELEVQLEPLSGSQGKIVSSHPFEKAMIVWTAPTGAETDHADLAADGSFFFDERSHVRGETITLVSISHPLWIRIAPVIERRKPLEVAFPDAAPVRTPDVLIQNWTPRTATMVGVAIGGLRVPQSLFAQYLALFDRQPFVVQVGPLHVPPIAETAPIDILRGPTFMLRPEFLPMDPVAQQNFTPIAARRLLPGVDRVILDAK